MSRDLENSLMREVHSIKERFNIPRGKHTLEYRDKSGSGRSFLFRWHLDGSGSEGYFAAIHLVPNHFIEDDGACGHAIFGLTVNKFNTGSGLEELLGNGPSISLEVPEFPIKINSIFYHEDGLKLEGGYSQFIPGITRYENTNHLTEAGFYEAGDMLDEINFAATAQAFLGQIASGDFSNPKLIPS